MNDMLEWYNSLDGTMQLLWICAIAASVVFVIQNALMLLGIGDFDSDASADVPTDFDTDVAADAHNGTLGSAGVFSLFTLRNFINFFLGFGWGGVTFASVIESKALLIIVSFLIGIVFVAIFAFLFRAILKLEHSGNFKVEECVGQAATVYLRIPANHTDAGKVQVSTGGAIHEMLAYTDGPELPSGAHVTVIKVIDAETLLVE